jgi:hypothetical protein
VDSHRLRPGAEENFSADVVGDIPRDFENDMTFSFKFLIHLFPSCCLKTLQVGLTHLLVPWEKLNQAFEQAL